MERYQQMSSILPAPSGRIDFSDGLSAFGVAASLRLQQLSKENTRATGKLSLCALLLPQPPRAAQHRQQHHDSSVHAHPHPNCHPRTTGRYCPDSLLPRQPDVGMSHLVSATEAYLPPTGCVRLPCTLLLVKLYSGVSPKHVQKGRLNETKINQKRNNSFEIRNKS
jgi:hypothetical protein